MPILVKTMRDLWDKKRDENKESLKRMGVSPIFPEEIQRHLRDYLVRKKAWREHKAAMAQIFSEYKDRLRDAGFLEIN